MEDDAAFRRPALALRAFVDGYVGYRLTGGPPGLHRGLPSSTLTFIVSIGPSIDLVGPSDPTKPSQSLRVVVSGLHDSAATIAHTGHQEGVAIGLSPLGARSLLGIPAAAIWDTALESVELLGSAGDELWERLQGPASWDERFSVCDEILLRRLDLGAGQQVAPELGRAWSELLESGGAATVADLASDVGWSRQHLTRQFRGEFGVGPKVAARVVRFERAKQMLAATPSFVSLAQVAASCGYADQSHLDREFAAFAGCSPTTWIREELHQVPSVQDGAGRV